MEYMGYYIEIFKGHVIVTDPRGISWTEDSVTDAKQTIQEERRTAWSSTTEIK